MTEEGTDAVKVMIDLKYPASLAKKRQG